MALKQNWPQGHQGAFQLDSDLQLIHTVQFFEQGLHHPLTSQAGMCFVDQCLTSMNGLNWHSMSCIDCLNEQSHLIHTRVVCSEVDDPAASAVTGRNRLWLDMRRMKCLKAWHSQQACACKRSPALLGLGLCLQPLVEL